MSSVNVTRGSIAPLIDNVIIRASKNVNLASLRIKKNDESSLDIDDDIEPKNKKKIDFEEKEKRRFLMLNYAAAAVLAITASYLIHNKQWSSLLKTKKIQEKEFKKKLCYKSANNTLYFKNWCDYSVKELSYYQGDPFCTRHEGLYFEVNDNDVAYTKNVVKANGDLTGEKLTI